MHKSKKKNSKRLDKAKKNPPEVTQKRVNRKDIYRHFRSF